MASQRDRFKTAKLTRCLVRYRCRSRRAGKSCDVSAAAAGMATLERWSLESRHLRLGRLRSRRLFHSGTYASSRTQEILESIVAVPPRHRLITGQAADGALMMAGFRLDPDQQIFRVAVRTGTGFGGRVHARGLERERRRQHITSTVRPICGKSKPPPVIFRQAAGMRSGGPLPRCVGRRLSRKHLNTEHLILARSGPPALTSESAWPASRSWNR